MENVVGKDEHKSGKIIKKKHQPPKNPRQEWMNNNLQKETSSALISDLPPVDIFKPAAANFRSTLLLKPSSQLLKQWDTYLYLLCFPGSSTSGCIPFGPPSWWRPNQRKSPCWFELVSNPRTDLNSGSWHQSWRLTRLIPGRESGGFLVTNSWHTSLMEVIGRSAVEVGSWHPIYLQDFIQSWWWVGFLPSTAWTWAHLADVDLSWCVGWWLMDSSNGFATLRCLKKRKQYHPKWWFDGDLPWHEVKNHQLHKSKYEVLSSAMQHTPPQSNERLEPFKRVPFGAKERGKTQKQQTSKFHSSPWTMMSFKTSLSS